MRGKHGAAAVVRHDRTVLVARATSAERRAEQLAADLARANAQAEASKRTAAEEARVLREQIETGTSVSLQKALSEIDRLRDDRETLRAEVRKLQKNLNKALNGLQSAYEKLGMTGVDAFDESVSLLAGEDVMTDPTVSGRKHNPAELQTIETARGLRSPKSDRARRVVAATKGSYLPLEAEGPE